MGYLSIDWITRPGRHDVAACIWFGGDHELSDADLLNSSDG